MTRQLIIICSGIAAIFFLVATASRAGDWSQFRGPNGVGSADDAALPVKWSATENLRWKAELPGRGLSCPVVAGGKVFLTACDGPEQRKLMVLCFDAATGKKLWQRSIWATGGTNCHPKTCMAAPTPVTDGTNVYALFATADLVAYDSAGNLLWYRSLTGDYPSITNQVGMASSPVLAPGLLVVPMENNGESFLAGIDLKTGKNVWKTDRPRDINWVTPVVRTQGQQVEIIFQGKHELVAYDAANGRPRWTFGDGGLSEIPSPIIGANNTVLVPGSDLVALQPGADGESPKVLWKSNKLRPGGYPTPLVYKGRIYSLTSNGVLTCGDEKDGKELWKERLKGPFSASPIAANGKIYAVNEKGVTQVVVLGDKPEVEATNDLADEILATPAMANGSIYFRSDKYLYCVGGKK